MIVRTPQQISALTLQKLGGRAIEINATRVTLGASVIKISAPRIYRRIMASRSMPPRLMADTNLTHRPQPASGLRISISGCSATPASGPAFLGGMGIRNLRTRPPTAQAGLATAPG